MPSYADSALFYDAQRRRRRWAQGNRGLQGYAEFLGGASDAEVGALVGAGTAAMSDSAGPSSAWRSIGIGVATGALTFLLNRYLERLFK